MNQPLRVLIVDDSEVDAQFIERHIAKAMVCDSFVRAWEFDAVEEFLRDDKLSLIVCDHFLPGFQSEDVLRLKREMELDDVPFILVSGLVDIGTAVSSMRNGANDFIFKDDLSRLIPAIEQALEKSEMLKKKRIAESKLRQSNEKLRFALKSLANMQGQLVAVERFRALGEMSSGIAHDFNNSLTKMLGTVDLIERRLLDDDPLIDQLKTQIGDAAAVVRRLCDFYRKNPAKDNSSVDVAEILEEVREFTRPRWSNRTRANSVSIGFEVDSEPHVYGWANTSSLREVLTNLIFNSCDAMEKTGGKILLRSELIGDYVEIEVRDEGEGMTPEVLNRCLEPLYSTKGKKGTGLGLSIVSGVVQSFGGNLRVESTRGKGTSVFVRLQGSRLELDATPGRDKADRTRCSRELRVLVVDDEPMIASLLTRQLRVLGHKAENVTDPHEALKKISNVSYDLIVSDRSMPQMCGDALAKKVLEISPSSRFAMATGYGDLMIANNEIPVGVDIILPKPVSRDSLDEAIELLFPPAVATVALAG